MKTDWKRDLMDSMLIKFSPGEFFTVQDVKPMRGMGATLPDEYIETILDSFPNVIRVGENRYKLSELILPDGSYCQEALGLRHHAKNQYSQPQKKREGENNGNYNRRKTGVISHWRN
jgi:hypothetical protein